MATLASRGTVVCGRGKGKKTIIDSGAAARARAPSQLILKKPN
jgi:hypothetical protein